MDTNWAFLRLPLLISSFCFALGVCDLGANDLGNSRYPLIEKLRFEPVNMAESEPSGQVVCIAQDAKGFIWYATREGAHRYDGYEVQTYANDPENPRSLLSDQVSAIFVDSKDRIWVGSGVGVSRYNPSGDDFANYLLGWGDYIPGSHVNVDAIVEDESGRIFASTESGYIYDYNEQADAFQALVEQEFGIIKSMDLGAEGELWIGSLNCVYRLDYRSGESRKFEEGLQPGDGTSNNFVQGIQYVAPNEVWLGTASNGTVVLDPASGRLEQLPYLYSHELYVHSLHRDRRGNSWIVHGDGLTIYSPDREVLARYNSQDPLDPLPSSGIHSMLLDAHGNVWAGSHYHGIYIASRNKLFHRLPDYATDGYRSRQTVISALLVDREGNLWVGRNATGMDVFWADGRPKTEFRNDPDNEQSIGPHTIFAIHQDAEGDIWVGSFLGGLQRYDPERGGFETFKHDPSDPSSIGSNDIRAIVEDDLGNFWLNAHGKGLSYFNRQTGVFTNYRSGGGDTDLLDDWPITLDLGLNNSLIVGTTRGLSILDTETLKGKSYGGQAHVSRAGLSNTSINDVFVDSQRRIWVATQGGLHLYDPAGDVFQQVPLGDEESGRAIASIAEDFRGALWLGTFHGLLRYDPSTHEVNTYTASDGLGFDEFFPRAVTRDAEGRLYFGHQNGVAFFRPEQIEENTTPPRVYVTDVKVLNRSLPIVPDSEEAGVLQSSVLESPEVRLKHEQKVVTFGYVALNYIQPKKNQYAYRLDGFDKDWQYVGSRREATYTNLNPGRYTFLVKASNNDGYWSEAPARLSVVIETPYWMTKWFRGLVLIALLFVPILYILYRLKRVRLQKRLLETTVNERTGALRSANVELAEAYRQLERNQSQIQEQNQELIRHRENLEQMVVQRTAELELAKGKAERSDRLKSAFLANMSHEIRTPMNAIIGLLDIVRQEGVTEEEREQYTEVIRQSSRTLMALIDDILDLSRIESGEATVQLQPCDVDEVCEELLALYRHVASTETDGKVALKLMRDGSEALDVSSRRGPLRLMFDPVRLKQILTNILSNAIKFTHEGEIVFGYETERNGNSVSIRFFVTDTGMGIPQDQLGKVFERFHKVEVKDGRVYRGSGLGLTISKKLAEMMGGQIEVESEFGKGTRFSVSFLREALEPAMAAPVRSMATAEDLAELPRRSVGFLDGSRILVVEDERPNSLFIQRVLERQGAEIHLAENGDEAIRLFGEGVFDLVLMDVLLPKKSGFEVLEHIRGLDTVVPVVMQTAYAMESEKARARELGATSFLSKPFTADQLLDALCEAVGSQVK